MGLNPLQKAAALAEYELILEALQKSNFNKTKAGKLLGIDRTSVTNKINRYKQVVSEMEKAGQKSISGTL